jgi:hypothetical protein
LFKNNFYPGPPLPEMIFFTLWRLVVFRLLGTQSSMLSRFRAEFFALALSALLWALNFALLRPRSLTSPLVLSCSCVYIRTGQDSQNMLARIGQAEQD